MAAAIATQHRHLTACASTNDQTIMTAAIDINPRDARTRSHERTWQKRVGFKIVRRVMPMNVSERITYIAENGLRCNGGGESSARLRGRFDQFINPVGAM